MILFGEDHLRRAIREFVEHYHEERPHQGLGNRRIGDRGGSAAGWRWYLLADFTAAARALGVSQVRMTHLMSLLLLAPQVQEAILAGTISPGDKQLRELARVADWSEQIDRLTRTNQSRRTPRPVTEAASPTTHTHDSPV